MAFAVHKTKKEKKRLLIRAVIEAFRAVAPYYLTEMSELLKEVRKNEYCKSGKLRAEATGQLDHGGYISMRVPRELFLVLRRFDKEFFNDSDDVRLLADEFPDLIDNKKIGPRK